MLPFVSIVVPCFNEEATICLLLEALLTQTYPHRRMEVVISDGMSTDKTRHVVAEFQREHPDLVIRVMKNPARTIPTGLNQAIGHARGDIVVRLDAHSMPIPEYIERCVAAIESGKGDNVGGIWEIRPGAQTWIAESISVATAHPLGVGDAMYRFKPEAGAVDTVPFGSFRRELIEKIGDFDDALLTNEDYEFNTRVRKSGGTVWLDPSIRSVYFARATLSDLAKQYWRYGFWKWRMLRRYPRTLRWRQALPPLFVLSLLVLFALSFRIKPVQYLFFAQIIAYSSVMTVVGLKAALEKKKSSLLFGLPLAIATMHITWGGGFLSSIITSLFTTRFHDILRPSLRLRPDEQRGALILGDFSVSTAAMFSAIYVWYRYTLYLYILEHPAISAERATRLFKIDVMFFARVPWWFYLLPLIWLLLMIEIYEPHAAANWKRTLRGVAIAALVGLLGYSLLFIISKDPTDLPRVGVGAFLVIASVLTLSWRVLYIRIYTTSGRMRRVLIVGAGKAGHTLADVYAKLNPPPFIIVGFVDDDPRKKNKVYRNLPVLGSSDKLLTIIDAHRISDLVVAINGTIDGAAFQSILDTQERGIEVTRMQILYEEMTGRVPVHHLESDWVIRSFVDQVRVSAGYEFSKRIMDIFGSLLGLAIFIIILPFAALATLIDSGRPVFYSQTRLGKGGAVFKIYKFRTMKQDAEADGEVRPAVENDPRVTRVGNFLRRTRLDETPQFFSVLRGEMSLVGPRAERSELVTEYQKQVPFYRARLLVKPGLTGWAQINYGYVASVTETSVKLEYDLYYIKHRTLSMDFAIVLRTIGTVLRQDGR